MWEKVNQETLSTSTERVSVGVSDTIVPSDTATDIQTKLDDLNTAATLQTPAILDGAGRQYTLSSPIELPSNVYLCNGNFTAADSADTTLIKSKDFDTLTGTTNFTDADGVPYNVGLVNVTVDGNKANNTSGYGVRLFARKPYVENLFIHDCVDDGLWTEAGSGSVADPINMPEMFIGSIYTKRCDGSGHVHRGPNDAFIGFAIHADHGGRGYDSDTSVNGNVSGTVIQHMHCWGNGSANRIDGTQYAGHLQGDGGSDQIHILSGARLIARHIKLLAAPLVNDGTLYANLVEGIGKAETTDGVTLNNLARIGLCTVDNYDGDGIKVEANNIGIYGGKATNNTGYGLTIGDTTSPQRVDMTLTDLQDNGTAYVLYDAGGSNTVRLNSNVKSGETALDLTNGRGPFNNDYWELNLTGSGSNTGFAKQDQFHTFDGDGSTTYFSASYNHPQAPARVYAHPRTDDAQAAAPIQVKDLGGGSYGVVFDTAPASGTGNVVVNVISKLRGRQ